jgi:hypothetical protein
VTAAARGRPLKENHEMRRFAALFALAILVGCAAQQAKKTENDAAAELDKAKDATAAEVNADLGATKKALEGVRAGAATLDKDVAEAYHATADDLAKAHDSASAAWDRAAHATESDWHKLGLEAKDAAAAARKAARRVEALTGEVKDDFVREAEAIGDELGKDVDTLEAKSKALDRKAHKEDVKLVADVRKDYEAVRKSLGKAKEATGDEWKDLRHGVNRDLHKLRVKVREASDKLEKA